MTVLPFLPEPEDRGLFGILDSLLTSLLGVDVFGIIPASLIESAGDLTVGEALAAISEMRLKDLIDNLLNGGDN